MPSSLLRRLGSGECLSAACRAEGVSEAAFPDWWRTQLQERLPVMSGPRPAAVQSAVRIVRDARGIPHISAVSESDLFFGFGYAIAQDRMFQLDYLRRRALGRLSEVLGEEALELDLLARTVGLHRIAEREWERVPESTQRVVEAYSRGINAYLDECRHKRPIEFDLLDYSPEPWRPQDCLAIEAEFQWYLTGRFPVIAIPELVKRAVGEGPLYRAFLQSECDDECILPSTGARSSASDAGGNPDATGSNNWVIAGRFTRTGLPLVASDPHIAFAAVSCWHEVHLSGAGFNVVGMSYVGMPAVMFGRNERVAWGCTNNICSLRDLYQERGEERGATGEEGEIANSPARFFYDGRWEPATKRTEVIAVRGRPNVEKTIRSSRNGPIVNEILPPPARETGLVSLRWLGAEEGGWLTALLAMGRSRSAAELREAMRPWHVPTFCVVYADVEGHIGYQCTGRIPVRNVPERGYRPGWDPAHQWAGLIPFEDMPAVVDPAQGFVVTANNRVAKEFPYPLSGTWNSGHRARRIREMLQSRAAERKLMPEDCGDMHQDAVSLRAVECLPRLVAILGERGEGRGAGGEEEALALMTNWDGCCDPDQVGCTLFNVFFTNWCLVIADERLSGEAAALVAGAAPPLANALLTDDAAGWFHTMSREDGVRLAFRRTLQQLRSQLGPDLRGWTWGRLHTLQQKHILSGRGDLGRLLDRGNIPVRGDMTTVCNTGAGPNQEAATGAGYRLIADLADPSGGLLAIDAGSESGVPGSPHYDDQLPDWLAGRYHHLPLRGDVEGVTRTLEPA